jgi:predicted ATPase
MIYDALDNLSNPFGNDWTEKLDKLEKENKGLRHQCHEWKKKAVLYERALIKACIIINQEADAEAYADCAKAALTEDRECRCGTDCDTCISEYLIEQVEKEDRQAARDEIEGRKRMDEIDVAQEMSGRGKNG